MARTLHPKMADHAKATSQTYSTLRRTDPTFASKPPAEQFKQVQQTIKAVKSGRR